MARRRRTSPAEDLMDVVAMLPWWAGVALAVVSYLVLHRMAGQKEVVAAVKPVRWEPWSRRRSGRPWQRSGSTSCR